jgi:hypothetical protein
MCTKRHLVFEVSTNPSQLLGEKFRSDDTIYTIIENISDETKLRAKLYSFYVLTVHVRGGIYRALVFVFYIK